MRSSQPGARVWGPQALGFRFRGGMHPKNILEFLEASGGVRLPLPGGWAFAGVASHLIALRPRGLRSLKQSGGEAQHAARSSLRASEHSPGLHGRPAQEPRGAVLASEGPSGRTLGRLVTHVRWAFCWCNPV